MLFNGSWPQVRAFGVMYDHSLFNACKSPHQAASEKDSKPVDCRWPLLIILRILCGYVSAELKHIRMIL